MATKNTKIKPLLKGVLFGVLLFAGLYGNIVLHELGHFSAASYLGLDPEMHLFEPAENPTGFGFLAQDNYVSYTSTTTELSFNDFLVAFAGPLANFIFAGLLFVAFLMIPNTKPTLKAAVVMLMIPSLLSAVANLFPNPGVDGYVVWSYLR